MCVVVVTADAGAAWKLVFVIHGTLLIYCVNAHIFGNAIFCSCCWLEQCIKTYGRHACHCRCACVCVCFILYLNSGVFVLVACHLPCHAFHMPGWALRGSAWQNPIALVVVIVFRILLFTLLLIHR